MVDIAKSLMNGWKECNSLFVSKWIQDIYVLKWDKVPKYHLLKHFIIFSSELHVDCQLNYYDSAYV